MTVLFLLLFSSNLWAGETCVWQVYKSSFTQTQWQALKSAIQTQVENMNQPIQKIRIIQCRGGLAVQADCSIRNLVKVRNAETAGKIVYKGLRQYTNLGWNRKHPDWQVLKQFFYTINKSSYTVEVSTP